MRGRKPKPTKLKILEGNPGKRPLNDAEPEPRGLPHCPSWLDTYAKAEWKRIAPELARLGLLTLVDRAALAAYCCAVSQLKAAEGILASEGITILQDAVKSEDKDGNPVTLGGRTVEHPAVRIADKAMRQIRAFCVEFGLTPSSRGRMQTPAASQEVDEFERFLDHA